MTDRGVSTEELILENIASSSNVQLPDLNQVSNFEKSNVSNELSHNHAADDDEYFNVSGISEQEDSNSEGKSLLVCFGFFFT